MNVSLTAINLLWNSADLLVRRGGDSETGSALGSQQLEELLRYLFRAMQVRSKTCSPWPLPQETLRLIRNRCC